MPQSYAYRPPLSSDATRMQPNQKDGFNITRLMPALQPRSGQKPLCPLCLCVRKKSEDFVKHADNADFFEICADEANDKKSAKILTDRRHLRAEKNGGFCYARR